jgi:hypothetical protein
MTAIRTGRRVLALAAVIATTALGLAGPAEAANMPDWAADFDSAGDAFEGGGGGGGGGGGWRPPPFHPGTVSGGNDGVPTTCTSKPTPDGEELTCSPSYPATPLPPAGPTPSYGVHPGIGSPGGKGLGDRDGGVIDIDRDPVGERMVAEWQEHLRKWGEALGKDPEAVAFHDREMKRLEGELKQRGWRYEGDPSKPDFGTWYPPFLCC